MRQRMGRGLMKSALPFFALVGLVLGACDQPTIHKIVQHWGVNHPTDILKQTVGIYTYVYISPSFITRDDNRVYCLATKVADDERTAIDIYVFRNLIDKFTFGYSKFENNGKIKMHSEGLLDESQFVISFNNHVLTFWQCVPKDSSGEFKSVVGIAVDVNYLDDPGTQEAVEEGKRTLRDLGLDTGEDLNPCTPSLVHSEQREKTISN